MRKLLPAILAVAAVMGGASAANAATIVYQQGVFGAPSGYTLFSDFNDATAQSVVTSGSGYGFPTGTAPTHVAVPGNNTPYLSVYGNGSARIDFSDAVRSFSFDYSTVDKYNSIRIFYADNGFEDVSGGSLLGAGQVYGQSSGSFIVNGDGRLISGLRLSSTSNSFEVDNLAISANLAAVPEPATWAMLIAGFGMVGFSARRARKTVTKVTFA